MTSLARYLTSSVISRISGERSRPRGHSRGATCPEVVGVADVVLHPAVVPVEPERVGEVDVGAELVQDVGSPVPAAGGLEDDLGVLAGRCDHLGEGDRVVVDADRLEALAVLVGSDDQRPALVQIDGDVL